MKDRNTPDESSDGLLRKTSQHFIAGKTAGARVWKVIDRAPQVADAKCATPPQSLSGAIQLTGIHFAYPARPDVQIFNGLDLSVEAGQTVALVGESGSGEFVMDIFVYLCSWFCSFPSRRGRLWRLRQMWQR